ncbi:MAG: sensor histidine kinase [Bacteroidales bacterium]|nr:sensor histidine kinase [Bacteroidales bacterium]
MLVKRVCYFYSYLLVFLSLAIPLSSLGQYALNLDSLENLIEFQTADSNKVKLLILLSNELNKTNPKSSLSYSRKAFTLSENINYMPGILDALSKQSKSYITLGHYDSAKVVCNRAIFLSDSIHDKKRLANAYANFGHLLFLTEGNVKGYEYYSKSYLMYNSIDDSLGIAESLNGMGVMLMNQAKYDSAIYFYLKLIKISEKLGYINILAKGYNNLGIAYDEIDDYDKATYYFLESIKINEQLNNLILVGKAFSNLGNIRYRNEDYDSALILYNRAIEYHKKSDFLLGLADAYIGLGITSERRNRYNDAILYYQLAKDTYTILGDKEGILIAYKNQGVIHQGLGNYDKSIKIFDTCLLIAEEYELTGRKKELFYNLYNSYWHKNDFEIAFDYLLSYHLLKDSIINLEKEEIIADLQLKYEKEKDQALILALENENLEKDLDLRQRTNQRNIYLFSGSGIISIILFLFIFYQHKTRKDRIISEQKIQQLEEEKKLLAAKSIVEGQEEERKRIAKELHDGLGVLLSTAKMQFTSIKDKSPENRPLIDKATKLLEQAASDVRKISHNMMPGLLTKFGLYEATEDLIEQLDETEGLNANCEITGDTKRLPENTEIMLYRIFQEMVNNTLKHAEAKNIQLHMNILPEQMNITYSDDGKGFNIEEKLKSKSIGLTSIQSRVKFLSGQVNIESKPGEGVKYNMQMPI